MENNILSDSKKKTSKKAFFTPNQTNSTEFLIGSGHIYIDRKSFSSIIHEQSSTRVFKFGKQGEAVVWLEIQDEKVFENKRKLDSFRNLQHDWNHYNGLPIPDDLIQSVSNLIDRLDHQPSIFPTGRGTIQIEFSKDGDNEIEIELRTDGCTILIIKDNEEMERDISIDEIPDIISDFYAG